MKITQQTNRLRNRSQKDIDDILELFKAIRDQQIQSSSMRPTLFEWNVWRAMSVINHWRIQGNFIVDDTGLLISTASGGQSDIVDNHGNFKIGIEVTLSTGKK